jgi:hypothetical protein
MADKPFRLTVPRSQLEAELDERISAGEELLATPIQSPDGLDSVGTKHHPRDLNYRYREEVACRTGP